MAIELGGALTYDEILEMQRYSGTEGVNVKWLGATGDGSTDDTTAIQAAINWNSISMVVTSQTTSGTTLTFGGNLTAAFAARLNAGTNVNVTNVTDRDTLQNFNISPFTQTRYTNASASVGAGTVTISLAVLGTVEVGDVIRFDFADRGKIYFPPGTYKVTAALELNYYDEMSFVLEGAGNGSVITGSVNGAILSRTVGNTASGIKVVRNLKVVNGHATGTGIKLLGCVGASVENCHVTAYRGIECDSGNSWQVTNCKLTGISGASTTSGSIGIYGENATSIINTDIQAFHHGIRHSNVGLQVIGGRIEVCDAGIFLGQDRSGGTELSSAVVLAGISMESNITAIHLFSASNVNLLAVSQGSNDGAGPGGADPERGVYIESAGSVTLAGCNMGGYYSVAALDASGSTGSTAMIGGTFTADSGGGSNIIGPTDNEKFTSISNGHIGHYDGQQVTLTVGNLPTAAGAFMGKVYRVSDATSATPGRSWSGGSLTTNAVAGGGSVVAPVVCVWDGTAGAFKWVVI